mgnify:CR=1 FL=1
MASSYTVNGKTYTDHPLLDEIVYNCKTIMSGIVVKNDELANSYETEDSIKNGEAYITIKDNKMSLEVFPFTINLLLAYGYNYQLTKSILIDTDNIPANDRNSLLKFACNYFLKNYEETNDYYRMLIGLPPYNSGDKYFIYINSNDIPSNYNKKDEIDFSIPLHEMDSSIIAILDFSGKLNEIIESHRGSNYSYLRFLGDKKINLYNARKAKKWDIIYIPNVESLVEDRFKELYNLNKEVYLTRTYQEAYAFNSTYYDQCMIFMVLCETFNNMIVDTPEWYIRRDIFDIRSVEYFLESYGVPFFKEIPLKYQIRIVKNLNKLIKFKSSNKNNTDILEIFALDNVQIFKYYLYKKQKVDGFGNYLSDSTDINNYDLEFVQCLLGDTYDNYIKDQIYRTPYDDITYQDKYWDGEDEHSYIKNKHLKKDFTITPTKYMSIDYKVSMSDYLFQMQYFLGLILDSDIDTGDIKIGIPSIQSSVNFKLTDLFILLFLLTNGYYDCKSTVILPDNDTSDKVPKPSFKKYDDYNGGYSYTSEEQYDMLYSLNGNLKKSSPETFWGINGEAGNVVYSEIRSIEDIQKDWMKDKFPELFIEDINLIYGFNMNVNLDDLSEIISRRHSSFQFEHGFTLKDLGIDTYITTDKISSIEDLVDIYHTNKKCYDTLLKKMVYESDNRDEYKLMEYVFNLLFTKPFNYKFYTLSDGSTAKTLDEILKNRDYILYDTYQAIMSESNLDVRQDNIRSIMNDIVNTLEYYLNYDLDYIFSFCTVASFNSLVHYIWLMINFFKSYKVYLLDPYVTYVADNRLENSAEARDKIAEKTLNYIKDDKHFVSDTLNEKMIYMLEDKAETQNCIEILDLYAHFEPDPYDDYDYNGMYANSDTDSNIFKDADGGLVDDLSCIPYIMLNAGKPQGSNRDLWDLNGYGVKEMDNYLDLDGGYSEHIDDWDNSYFGKAFNYIIDAGSPSMDQFVSSSIHTRIIDNQIENKIKISSMQGNIIKETEDGIYLQQNWISWSDFDDFRYETNSTYNYFSYMYEQLIETLELASNESLQNKKIQSIIDAKLEPMRTTISYMENDTFENNLKKYTDDKVSALYAEFYNFTPFEWGNF